MKTSTLTELKNQLENAKKEMQNNWALITGIESKKIGIINDEFISINVDNLKDVKKIVSSLTPYKNTFDIKHTNCMILTSDYRITLCNNYYKRELKFEFEMINNLKFWVSIDVENLPSEFKEKYLKRSQRALYDTEEVYVSLQSHMKQFKEIRIVSYDFNFSQVGWYGGDKTLIDTNTIKEMINDIKSI